MMSDKRPLAVDAYDEHGTNYAVKIAENLYNAFYERAAILNLLPDLAEKRVLDAGCGPGFHTEWMVQRGAQVTAVDVSAKMVEIAQERVGEKATFYQHDLTQPLHFLADQSQDIVLSSLAVHYILDLQTLFAEYARVLKGNCRFLFSTGNPILEQIYFKRKDYFATELVHDVWQANGAKMQVSYYARPLTAITTALGQAGFWIENIIEPQPSIEAKEQFPQRYEFLSKNPWFMIFVTRKKELSVDSNP